MRLPSLQLASLQFLKTRYTLGRAALDDPYHIDLIKEKLMRSLSTVVSDVIDELTSCIPHYIATQGEGRLSYS